MTNDKKERDANGYWPNIEQLLQEWIKTKDEDLYNEIIYPYLTYLAAWEKKQHNTSLYDDGNLIHDMVSHATINFKSYNPAFKTCTAQSWARMLMKQFCQHKFNYLTKDKRNVFQAVSLDKLKEENSLFDIAESLDTHVKFTPQQIEDMLHKFDKAVGEIKLSKKRRQLVAYLRKIITGEVSLDNIKWSQLTAHIAKTVWPDLTDTQIKTRMAMVNSLYRQLNKHINRQPVVSFAYRRCPVCRKQIRYTTVEWNKRKSTNTLGNRMVCDGCRNNAVSTNQ